MGTILENLDKLILEGEAASKSLGAETLQAVSQAELIDSAPLYTDYLASIEGKIDREEGQLLVYTENTGFKIINIPHSMVLWARRKQEKQVCLIKPNSMTILQRAIDSLTNEQTTDLYKLAILNLLMDSVIWMLKHSKSGCKFCNRLADLQVMPALYHSLKTSRLGSKSLIGEEEYMARRIGDVIRLPGNQGKTHDVLVPKKLVRGLIQQLYNHKDNLIGPELTELEYVRRFSDDIGVQARMHKDVQTKATILASIIIKNNPTAREYSLFYLER